MAGKNVVITGSNSGFGLLTALKFARGGDNVVATMRTPSKGEELRKTAEAEKLPLTIEALDVTDVTSIERVMSGVEARGGVDVLVNNAGYELRSPIELADDDEVRDEFDTNVLGMLRTIRAVAPAMRERGRGTIVNLSSIAGLVAPPFGGWYGASKHAIEAMSEALHYELQPWGVRVAIVEPGAYATGFRGNIKTARRFTQDTPYWERFEAFEKAFEKIRAAGAGNDPQQIADTVHEAVYTETPKLRYVCGTDAQMIMGVRKSTDFEGFEAAMRKTLDWWD